MSSDKINQRTLCMIKPDAVDRVNEILKLIQEEGFSVIERRRLRLSKDDAEEFYGEHREKSFFLSLVSYMTSGDVMAVILSCDDAITKWRLFIGPTKVSEARSDAPNSLRARFGDRNNDSHNGLHGSDSPLSALREIKFFFPELSLEPVLTGEGAKEYLSHSVSPVLVKALTELCKVRPEDPIVWLADWLLTNNPNKNI